MTKIKINKVKVYSNDVIASKEIRGNREVEIKRPVQSLVRKFENVGTVLNKKELEQLREKYKGDNPSLIVHLEYEEID